MIYLIIRERDTDPTPRTRSYHPTTTLNVPGDPMVIAAPHAKEEITHTTPSPTPPVAAISSTLQPPPSTQEDLMGKIIV